MEGYKHGYLQIHHKLHLMEEGESQDADVYPLQMIPD